MIGTSIFKLCGCNIQYSLAGAIWDQMDKSQQILTGIPKAHAASGSGFKVRSRTGHIKGNHALILIPDIDHAVELFFTAFYRETGQQICPVFF